MQEIKEFIKEKIKNATAEKPITSTQLIQLVYARFQEKLDSRKVRRFITELQKEGCPIAGLKTDCKGYFWINNLNDYKRYEREVNNYWQTVKATRDLIKANFLQTPKSKNLSLFEV